MVRYRVWRPSVEDAADGEDVSTETPPDAAEHYARSRSLKAPLGFVHVLVRALDTAEPDTAWNVRVQQTVRVAAYPEDRRAEGPWAIELRGGSYLESLDAAVGCPAEVALRFHSEAAARAFISRHEWIGFHGGMPKRLDDD